MCEVARTKFAWKKTDNIDLKIADCVRQLQDLLSMRKLVNKKDSAENLYKFLYLLKTNVFRGILESACLSVHVPISARHNFEVSGPPGLKIVSP